MKTITFTCETITPMFLSGADGQTPELRPPSIKGALRFWWRAMHGHLSLNELKEQESLIFGGTDGDKGGRSKVLISIAQNDSNQSSSEAFMLPHKTNEKHKSPQCAFNVKNIIIINLKLTKDKVFYQKKMQDGKYKQIEIMNINLLKNLFIITGCLGGFGKRSRRGFGSIKINQIHIENKKEEGFKMPAGLTEIYNYLDKTQFKFNKKNISTNFRSPYPCILTIELGGEDDSVDSLTKKIGEVSHKIKGEDDNKASREDNYKKQYAFSLGNGRRLASPIYTTIIQDNTSYRVLITTLNTIPKDGWTLSRNGKVLQDKFKNELL